MKLSSWGKRVFPLKKIIEHQTKSTKTKEKPNFKNDPTHLYYLTALIRLAQRQIFSNCLSYYWNLLKKPGFLTIENRGYISGMYHQL